MPNPSYQDCNDCPNYSELIERLLFFNKVSQNILEKKPLPDLLNEIINSSKSLLNAEASSLLLYDRGENYLYFHTVSGEKRKALTHKKIKIGEGIAGWVAQHKNEININDCYSDPRFNKDFDKATGFKTRNMLCAPMIRKNELVGVIQVINKKDNRLFNEQDIDLFNLLASECALAIENARLAEVEIKTEQLNYELKIAHQIQQKLLPSKLPKLDGYELSAELIPAKEIGGDYYNVIKIDDDQTLFFVADVSGKSVSAALIVSTIYSFIQTYLIISSERFDLRDFVQSLNTFLITSTTQDKFATAWFGLLIHSEKKLISINAGHNPTFFFDNSSSELIELTKGGLLLGSIDFPYESEAIKLKRNDLIIFYTDGIPEAMNKSNIEYGEDRFKKLIVKYSPLPPDKLLNKIITGVKKFRGTAEQSDDVTFGVIKTN